MLCFLNLKNAFNVFVLFLMSRFCSY